MFQNQATETINHNDDASTVTNKLTALSRVNGITLSFSSGSTICSASGTFTAITFTHNPGNLMNLVMKENTLVGMDVKITSLLLLKLIFFSCALIAVKLL